MRGRQTRCAPVLLAHRARHENLGRTFRVVRRAALEQNLRRAFVLRLGVDTFAGLESLAAAGRGGRRLAVRGAVLRRGAALAHGHDARVWQSHDCVGRILGDVTGVLGELIERRLRALQIRLEPGRALVEPVADRIDEARLENGIRRRRRGGIGGGLARLLARNIAGRPQLLRGRGRGQAKHARGHDRARDGCERTSLNYFRMAGHPDPVDVTAARRLGAGRGKIKERWNSEVRSKRVANYRIQDDHKSSNYTGNQSQPPLNEMTDGFAEPLEGPSQNEEPSTAGNQT